MNEEKNPGAARDCAVLMLLAFLVRAAFVVATPQVLDTADAIHYLESAQQISIGHFFGFDAKIPVLYPALTALAGLFILNWEAAAVFVSFVAGVCLVLPVYGLSRDMHARGPARISGLAVALWPWLADYSNRVGPDMLAATLWFTSVWLLERGLRRGGLYVPAAALAFFLLHLTRPEGTFLLAAAPLAALLLLGRGERKKLWRLIPYAAVCAALLGAYAAYMSRVAGHAAINYRADRILMDFEFVEMAKTAVKTISEVLPVMLGPVLLLFIGVGFFYRPQEDEREGHPPHTAGGRPDGAPAKRDLRLEFFVLFYAFCQWFLSLFVLSPEPRYQMSVLVALSMWSALGIVVVARRARALRFGRLLQLAPAASLVVLMLFGVALALAADHMHRQPTKPLEYKTAGLWMRENLAPGLIFSRKPQIAYYADMPSTGPDLNDTLEGAVDRAKKAGARYVVVDERYTAQMAPGMAPLLNPRLAPDDLRLIKQFAPYPRSRVVIYEVVQRSP